MIDLGFINVAGAVVGSTYTIDWHNVRIEPTLRQQASNITDAIALYNESGVGFLVTMTQTSRSFTLPAGAWAQSVPATVPGGVDLSLTLTAEYVLPSPAVSHVHVDYYGPGEETGGASIVLGNSPVNGSISNIVATSLVNTGNSPLTPIITSNSSPSLGSVNTYNDGSGTRNLLSAGNFEAFESFTNGTGVAEAVVTYGVATDLTATTFNGQGNFNDLVFSNLTSAGGVTTAGIWVAFSHVAGTHVTVNTLTTIMSFNLPVTGVYRANCYFAKLNATASAVSVGYGFTDDFGSAAANKFFSTDNAGAYLNLRGVTTITTFVGPCFPVVFEGEIGTSFFINYQDPTGTANDWVSADLEVFVI